MELIQELLSHPIGLLFIVIAVGLLLGSIPLLGFRLGASGILIAGLFFGHFGYLLPQEIQTLGVVLFVYSVGLRAGPSILNSMRKSKGVFLILALVTVGTACGTAVLLKHIFDLPPQLLAGIYAGAMTSTPALAAAMEAIGDSTASVAFGLAYPLGILSVVIFVQMSPKLFKISIAEEASRYEGAQTEPIVRRIFEVTNEKAAGHTVKDLAKTIDKKFRLVRIKRGETVFTPHAEHQVERGDLLLAVGPREQLSEIESFFGKRVEGEMPYSESAASRWALIASKQFIGKKLGALEISSLFGVIITRVRRGGVEFSPTINFVFEAGDEIRISGAAQDLERFEKNIRQNTESLYETDVFSLAVGLVLGVLAGMISIPVGAGLKLSLGIAGGPLIVGLIFGHVGRFGRLTGRMPRAAVLLTGELGLYLFLAVAGSAAGLSFWNILKEQGLVLVFAGFLITLMPILTTVLVGRYLFKQNFLILLGMICGGMTSTPALGVLTSSTKSEIPSLGYTSIYPAAILLTTLAAQILVKF